MVYGQAAVFVRFEWPAAMDFTEKQIRDIAMPLAVEHPECIFPAAFAWKRRRAKEQNVIHRV